MLLQPPLPAPEREKTLNHLLHTYTKPDACLLKKTTTTTKHPTLSPSLASNNLLTTHVVSFAFPHVCFVTPRYRVVCVKTSIGSRATLNRSSLLQRKSLSSLNPHSCKFFVVRCFSSRPPVQEHHQPSIFLSTEIFALPAGRWSWLLGAAPCQRPLASRCTCFTSVPYHSTSYPPPPPVPPSPGARFFWPSFKRADCIITKTPLTPFILTAKPLLFGSLFNVPFFLPTPTRC